MKTPPEDPVRLVECLKSLGITKYEALVYIALLRVPSATASEIHDSSSVPRASVYPVLDQLVDKDLVSVSQSAPKRFAAIPPTDAITRLLSRIERDAESARSGLLAIHRQRIAPEQGNEELIWNLYGLDAIRRKLVDLISGATNEVHLIAHPTVLADEVREAITAMSDRVAIEVVTPYWDGLEAENLKVWVKKYPDILREPGLAKDMMAGGICIIDGRKIMVIVGSGTADAVALYSESEGFVRFFLRYYSLIIDWAKKSGKTLPA
jgi:HTH-type transcriptional regulator, sugar sensing transcriptional regulator